MSEEPTTEAHVDDETLLSAVLRSIGSWVYVEDRSKSLPTETRDLALGRFMDAWSELEGSIRGLLHVLMKAPLMVAVPVASAIPDLGRMRDLLLALGRMHLTEKNDIDELQEICKYLQINGKFRNSIVHGQWHTFVMPVEGSPDGSRLEWVRVYNIVGIAEHLSALMGWDAGAKEQFVFTIARLEERAAKARKFAEQVDAFSKRIGTVEW